MTGQTTANVLRRIARPAAVPPPLTPARALRLSLTRAADRSMSLALGVLGVTEDEASLDDQLARLEDGLLLLALSDDEGPVGLVGLDPEARSAVIEAQALGQPLAQRAAPRAVTVADVAMAEPLLSAFVAEVEAASPGTSLEGWIGGARPDGRLASARDAGLVLPDGSYRAVRLKLDLGAGDRRGLLVLLLRIAPPPACAAKAPAWDDLLSAQVLRAHSALRAVLQRVPVTIETAETLRVGQVLPLPGVTVASVRIEGPGGADLGPARLGQVGGMRAVRLEAPLAPLLGDMGGAMPGSMSREMPGDLYGGSPALPAGMGMGMGMPGAMEMPGDMETMPAMGMPAAMEW